MVQKLSKSSKRGRGKKISSFKSFPKQLAVNIQLQQDQQQNNYTGKLRFVEQ